MRRFGRRRTGRAATIGAVAATAFAMLFVASCGRSLYAPPACSDGVDNDHDGRTDLEDPQCADPGDDDEGPASASDADVEVDVELDGGAETDVDTPADVDTGTDADADVDAPGDVDTGADADADVDTPADVEADGDVREPCVDGLACDAMPIGRCVSGACASIWVSSEAGNQFGQAVALEGARADAAPALSPGFVLVGAPDATTYRGRVVLGEATFWREVISWDGSAANERFGYAVAIGPSLDVASGLALTVGANTLAIPAARGRVAIYGSAEAGVLVRELVGPLAGSAFGSSVAWGPDVTGDGVEDLAVGAPSYRPGSDTVGAVFLYAGGTWSSVRSWSGTAGSLFGTAVARGPGGGRGRAPMTVIGAPGEDTATTDAGCAYVYEGTADGWVWSGCGEGLQARFGKTVAAGTDVDGDGHGDFAVGSPGWDDRTGKVYLHALGGPWRTWSGSAEGDDFGWAIALGPDADGRRGGELLVGAPGVGGNRGRVLLFRYDQDAPLRTWDGEAAGDRFGCAVSLGGDIDGDGLADALVGACGSASAPGKVYLFGSASW